MNKPTSNNEYKEASDNSSLNVIPITSNVINEFIYKAKSVIENQDLYTIFSQAFTNTLNTTIRYTNIFTLIDHHTNQNQQINTISNNATIQAHCQQSINQKTVSNTQQSNHHNICVDIVKQSDTYVITGDIEAMWLRDSSAQVWPYLFFSKYDAALQYLIAGVINRQARYIRLDPYANAFNYNNQTPSMWAGDVTTMNNFIHERKWEIDSLCYHVRLCYGYYQATGDVSPFKNDDWLQTAQLIYNTFAKQQLKTEERCYTFRRNTTTATDTLPNNGLGNPVKAIGLIASGFRPSDDATILPFLVPANFFAVKSLRQLADLIKITFVKDGYTQNNDTVQTLINNCLLLANEVESALLKYAVIHNHNAPFTSIFAYEVDGYGGQIIMDDANIPSLLSLPYLGCVSYTDPIYQATRSLILSHDNPWYFSGSTLSGVGSIHTGENMVWPLAVIMQGLTANNKQEEADCLKLLTQSHADTYFMHESINKNNQHHFTRSWFAWANSLFAELVIKHYGLLPQE